MSATLRGSLLATLALALVGSLVASADLVEGYPLPTGQALRYALAAAVLALVARGRLPRLDLREALGIAALSATGLVLFNLFVIEGVRETDPATIGVIVGCVPVVLALVGPLMEGRPLSPRVIAAAAVVSAGAAGVQWAGGGITATGLLLALGALACEAAFSLLAVPRLKRRAHWPSPPMRASSPCPSSPCELSSPTVRRYRRGRAGGGPDLHGRRGDRARVRLLVFRCRSARVRRAGLFLACCGERARLLGLAGVAELTPSAWRR